MDRTDERVDEKRTKRGEKARKLTAKLLNSLKPKLTPKPRAFHVYDSELRGFFATVNTGGRISFGVRYGGRKNRRSMTVGEYGVLTVDEGREAARRLLAAAALGDDPALARERKQDEPLIEEWVRDYLKEVQKTKKSWKEDERYLTLASKRWGRRFLSDVTPSDVEAARATLSSTPAAANRFLASVSKMFSTAVQRKVITSNPAARIPLYRENPPRSRVLSEAELIAFGAAVEAERERDPGAWVALRLLLETGARLGEVLGARWSDVDLDSLRWRLPDPKAGTAQTVVLHQSTVDWLRTVKDQADGLFVVRGAKKDEPRYDLKNPWERVRRAAGIEDATIHDIRRTFGKIVARESGLHMASALLRHSDVRITARTYAPHAEAELRDAVSRVLPFLRRTA